MVTVGWLLLADDVASPLAIDPHTVGHPEGTKARFESSPPHLCLPSPAKPGADLEACQSSNSSCRPRAACYAPADAEYAQTSWWNAAGERRGW